MTNLDHPDWQETVDLLCFSAARQILEGVSFPEFRDRMEGMVGLLLKAGGVPKEAQQPEMQRCMATAVALEIWNITPVPENRFRPRKQPKPERNAPCLCGSGKKFKQCCAAVDGPELGISEELMLSKVLSTFSRKRLLELPLLELSAHALAAVAHDWLEHGRAKDAVALLEKLFEHLPELNERAEWAADLLLNAYMEVNAPRKKQKFIEDLKAAPDKMLASTGWQRQTVVHSDRGEYAKAWEAFRAAQRLTPNEPALSHLEVLVLVSEGRRDEAQARAKFWAARLARDQQYDHTDLIKLLHDLADGSDNSLLRTLPLGRGPLTDLAEIVAQWPEPACHYQLSGGAELTPKKDLYELERDWQGLSEERDVDLAICFLSEEALAGQSFRVLRDVTQIISALPENLPGSADALARKVLERGENLRRLVLGRLKALNKELPWGFLENRPLLTLVSYYANDFIESRPKEVLDLLRWSVNIANPTDNTGLRDDLIHMLIATGKAAEAIDVAARYPNDFASTEYGRVLALFAAGQLNDAEAALKIAAEKSPKVWKTLHAANPKKPASKNPGYITIGGNDEAYEYRQNHLALWRSTGALKWSAGIKLPAKSTAKPKAVSAVENAQNPLFE
jgi:tetratricopeptide (TPR) repeat protein